jgi:hypothetical protein
MRVEGRLQLDPADSEVYVGGESLLTSLLKCYNEGDVLRVQVDRIARNQPPPLLRDHGIVVRMP